MRRLPCKVNVTSTPTWIATALVATRRVPSARPAPRAPLSRRFAYREVRLLRAQSQSRGRHGAGQREAATTSSPLVQRHRVTKWLADGAITIPSHTPTRGLGRANGYHVRKALPRAREEPGGT